MIRFVKNDFDLWAESRRTKNYFGQIYLRSVRKHIKERPLIGFAFNVGTISFFAVTNKHKKLPIRFAYKFAKRFMYIFGKGNWNILTLTNYIRKHAEVSVIDFSRWDDSWDISGMDKPFYGFDQPYMVVDA